MSSTGNDNVNNGNIVSVVISQAKHYMDTLEKELAKNKYCNEIERVTGISKSYMVLGSAAAVFTLIFFNLCAQLLTNAIAWVYPAYASFKAIESPSTKDDTQWLTYWTVLGFLQVVEYFTDILLRWFPFYYTFKTLLVIWLILPQFQGAEVFYNRFLRPLLISNQSHIDKHTSAFSSNIQKVSDQVQHAALNSLKEDRAKK
ncbi:TB2/DP1, HVA22 family-domain-containing protein [Pilobolus umbonatus]|nr:TB2/DP1, HVA22 family-domain-containing protein [Pilobolus umbonatus]